MTFGKTIRELRHGKEWSLRDLAAKVDVGFTYLSRVENERLNFGDYPSDALIHRLADALEADEEELLILAKRVPDRIRQRFLERPDAFGRIADLDDAALDALIGQLPPLPQQHRFPKKRIARKPRTAQ
jgi:transcriptional regulator with XRE-family HTH domain